ncbi:cell division protein FtsH, partial [Arthrospira platensis SPKY2]
MSIKKKPKIPKSRKIANLLLILAGLILIGNWLVPQITRPRIPKVPYSLFIQQIERGEVKAVLLGD